MTSLTPIGLEVLVLQIFEIKRIDFPLKLDHTQALSLTKSPVGDKTQHIYISIAQHPHAGVNSTGHIAGVHNQAYIHERI